MSVAISSQKHEPVPDGSEFLALPFLSAIAGLFSAESEASYRVTLHRVMSRGNEEYLQQVARYVESSSAVTTGVGRIFDVNFRIIGNAFETKKIWRTKHYSNLKKFESDMATDMKIANDFQSLANVPRSWLAIPFLAKSGRPTLVLFADSKEVNFFADDARIRRLAGMCAGFARLLDSLQLNPIGTVRNFPLTRANEVRGKSGAYPTIHEALVRRHISNGT